MQHERREAIKKLLEAEGTVRAPKLAEQFSVSAETIRRDLEDMETEGLLLRVHGGAVNVDHYTNESAYQSRMREHRAEKAGIAAAAAELIRPGDTVIISPGTTTLEVAGFLKGKKNLTVITNSLPIAISLADDPEITICCLGGKVRGEDYSANGVATLENLKLFNVDKLILGVGCISAQKGVTDYRMDDVLVNQQFAAMAPVIIGVADSSKFGRVSRYNVCPTERLTYMVTDTGISPQEQQLFLEKGVQLITVKI